MREFNEIERFVSNRKRIITYFSKFSGRKWIEIAKRAQKGGSFGRHSRKSDTSANFCRGLD
jgi:hypothetical protein